MNYKNIVLGEYYRFKGNTTAWALPIEILPPKTGKNTTNKIIAKCEWSTSKGSNFTLIKYFAISNLIEGETK